ncbi:MAG: C39 family peptidase [Anaerotignum sp.]|nr:C39 family peptidase [Anaerotignum sp.]
MRTRKRKKNIGKKIFNTIFVGTYVSFVCFLYLFATRITPWDIDYFIKDSQRHTTQLVTTLKTQKAAYDAKREAVALAKTAAKKKIAAEKIAAAKMAAQKNAVAENAAPKNSETKDSDETILQSSKLALVYYSQDDPRWDTIIYGEDNPIGVFGCGPTTLAMVVSTFTENEITPDLAAQWAYNNGHFCYNSGSYHSIIPQGAVSFGLTSKSLIKPSKEALYQELSNGNLVVVLMNKGIFTSQGHFIILRGFTEDGKILIADSQSLENSQRTWDIETFLEEAKYSASAGGPFWSISKTK